MPGMPSNVPGATAVPPAQAVGGKSTRDLNGADRLPLDANLYGTIEFEQPDGDAVSLSISDRETGEELLRKNYPDGSVYEYLDFGRFQAPLERIAVVIMDEKGQTIRELTPVSAN
jgi:hypothetical protein